MFFIANNITTRKRAVSQIFRQAKTYSYVSNAVIKLQELTKLCTKAGADALEINIQQYHDQPKVMEFAINAIQHVAEVQLCLSTNNTEALELGLQICKRPPLVNYVSVGEARLRDMLHVICRYGAEVVLLVSDPAAPTDAQEMLRKAVILVGAANEAGIPNEHILIDPGLIHITNPLGQRHLIDVREFLQALQGTFEHPIRSTCWIANASAGAPRHLRPAIEMALLPMLAGLGLSSVFLDVLRRENMRTAHLIKIFNNESIYSQSDIEP